MLRTDPKWTKSEIREYLLKVYGVRTERIATYIAAGACRRRVASAGALLQPHRVSRPLACPFALRRPTEASYWTA